MHGATIKDGRGLELILLLYNAENSDSGTSKPFFN
jgi:hypothetical protein